jgi:hypothetical protein
MAGKLKKPILSVLLFCALPLCGPVYGVSSFSPSPARLNNTPLCEIKEGLLTVQNAQDSNKERIKERMKYIDKVIEEIDKLLYSENRASREVLQKIKRLLTELDKLQKSGNHY